MLKKLAGTVFLIFICAYCFSQTKKITKGYILIAYDKKKIDSSCFSSQRIDYKGFNCATSMSNYTTYKLFDENLSNLEDSFTKATLSSSFFSFITGLEKRYSKNDLIELLDTTITLRQIKIPGAGAYSFFATEKIPGLLFRIYKIIGESINKDILLDERKKELLTTITGFGYDSYEATHLSIHTFTKITKIEEVKSLSKKMRGRSFLRKFYLATPAGASL